MKANVKSYREMCAEFEEQKGNGIMYVTNVTFFCASLLFSEVVYDHFLLTFLRSKLLDR